MKLRNNTKWRDIFITELNIKLVYYTEYLIKYQKVTLYETKTVKTWKKYIIIILHVLLYRYLVVHVLSQQIINIYPMRRYRIWRFIQSSHVISDEALAELDIILARLNKSPYPILPNRINILSFTIIKKRKRKFIFLKQLLLRYTCVSIHLVK